MWLKQKKPGCKSISFAVLGMTCSSCASRIEKKILGLDGVVASRVNFSTEMVFVDFDPQKIILKEILETVKQIGFDVLITQKNFPIKNLSCSSCVSKVQDILTKNYGVLNAQVNLAVENVRGALGQHFQVIMTHQRGCAPSLLRTFISLWICQNRGQSEN